METLQKQELEQINSEHGAPSVSVEADLSVNGAAALHDSLDDIADSFDVRGFKCTDCGLAHSHDTTKHRATDSFDMSVEEATSMEMNGSCHCGVQELGRRGSDFGVDEADASSTARNAPIPDETSRDLNERFGSLS